MIIPQWLQDFWTTYSNVIIPMIETILGAFITYISIKIRSDAKLAAKKTDLEIEALQNVSKREDFKPEIDSLKKVVTDQNETIKGLSELFNTAFQNSSLDPVVKDTLTSIKNKIQSGSNAELAKQLEEQLRLKEDELSAISVELEKSKIVPEIIEPVVKNVIKKIRK